MSKRKKEIINIPDDFFNPFLRFGLVIEFPFLY